MSYNRLAKVWTVLNRPDKKAGQTGLTGSWFGFRIPHALGQFLGQSTSFMV
jgi:hypothetical protein